MYIHLSCGVWDCSVLQGWVLTSQRTFDAFHNASCHVVHWRSYNTFVIDVAGCAWQSTPVVWQFFKYKFSELNGSAGGGIAHEALVQDLHQHTSFLVQWRCMFWCACMSTQGVFPNNKLQISSHDGKNLATAWIMFARVDRYPPYLLFL